MVDKLRSRSLIDNVFVSKSSQAKEPFCKRDVNGDVFEEADGNTRDLLRFLKFSKKQVILVTLDYAGLTTNVEDLKQFLKNNKNIAKIVVDRYPLRAEMEVLERETLLHDQDCIQKFDCRPAPVQRSL